MGPQAKIRVSTLDKELPKKRNKYAELTEMFDNLDEGECISIPLSSGLNTNSLMPYLYHRYGAGRVKTKTVGNNFLIWRGDGIARRVVVRRQTGQVNNPQTISDVEVVLSPRSNGNS